jgi:hypothetical protein
MITNTSNQLIKGTFKGGVLRVWVLSTGMQGKDIRFKIYEEDVTLNQLILEQEFTIDKDKYPIDVTLKKIGKSKSDDYFEGAVQELFVDIEVIESAAHFKSATVDVDVKTFKIDKPDNTTKTVIGESKSIVEDVLDAYFAVLEFTKKTNEKAGKHTYTFQNENKNIDKDKVADIILNKVEPAVKKGKKYQ